ncbi:MAG: peptidoglycan-binding protein, partial [Vicinamibacterales bacterium]
MRTVFAGILVPFVAVSAVACSSARKPHEVSPALETIVSGKVLPNVEPDVWTDVRAFYTQREHAPAWVDNRRPTSRAAAAITALNTARRHGYSADDYGAKELLAMSQEVEKIDKESPERLQHNAGFDARLTAALLTFGRDVAIGRAKDRRWKSQRKAPDLVATLTKIAGGDATEWVDAVRPPHAEYEALANALEALHGQKEKGGWVSVPAVSKPGASGPAVAALRQRLSAGGYFKGDAAASSSYDADVEAAAKSFQELHGIKATGIVDQQTLAALNVPLDTRMRQVALNLQRWRWMPDDMGDRHFLINIPYFHVIAREHGKPVMDIRVIVGKVGNNTPLFSDEMETVVFSPYWNIPDSIAQGETLPAIARDPAYLARQNIEIVRTSGGVVSASDVDWSNPEALKG